jgi:glyoxylase-like metal-dependent hydrolase (beta-lactamase superfamily II)
MLVIHGLHASETTLGGRAYLVEGAMECAMVDTGRPDGGLGAGHLVTISRRPLHEVRLILLTHAHPGHAGNAAALRLLTGARLAASEETARMLRTVGSVASGARLPFGRRGKPWPPEPIRVEEVLTPGQVLDIAGGIEVFDAPGHLPGALAFHCYGPNALCVGDAARVERRGGRLAPPPLRQCADPAAARATATRLAEIGARVLAPGHGLPSVDGQVPSRFQFGE